jgi:hypothetical protein
VSVNGIDGPRQNGPENFAQPAEPAQAKPEVLPWRTRLKSRLGARLFHQDKSEAQPFPDEEATGLANDSSPPPPPPAPLHTPLDNSSVNRKPTSSAKTTELQVPKTALATPEARRPDWVME